MNTAEINPHTRKKVSERQYSNMGKINGTTQEKSVLNIEKTFIIPDSNKPAVNKDSKNHSKPLNPELKKPQNTFKKTATQVEYVKAASVESPKSEIKYMTKPASELVTKPLLAETATIVGAVNNAQNYIIEQFDKKLEERLEKLDEAVLELISSKAEIERLKQKVDKLTRENFKLKREVTSYKPIVGGVYLKKNKEISHL